MKQQQRNKKICTLCASEVKLCIKFYMQKAMTDRLRLKLSKKRLIYKHVTFYKICLFNTKYKLCLKINNAECAIKNIMPIFTCLFLIGKK